MRNISNSLANRKVRAKQCSNYKRNFQLVELFENEIWINFQKVLQVEEFPF